MTQAVQPPAVLLFGGPGSGKTYSIYTLLELGLEVFVVNTEPTGLDSLLDVVQQKKLDINKLHWTSINPNRGNLADLMSIAKKVSIMDYDGLSKLKPTGDRGSAKWMDLLVALNNFKDARTDKLYGPVTDLGPKAAVVVDSLSGISIMAMDMVIGDKPTAHQGEWGVAMNLLEKLILNLSSSLTSTFVLTAHIERETSELTGATQLMASTLGRKLAPKLPRFFSEVVMSYREGDQFYWSTTALQADLKKRVLPLSAKITPSFAPVVEAYWKRLELATTKGEPQPQPNLT